MSTVATLRLASTEGDDLRFTVVTSQGRRLTLDSGAAAVAPSPVDLLLVSLAGCHGMDVISILRKQRQAVRGYEIAVSGERRAEHPRAFVSIELVHRLAGDGLDPAAIDQAITLSHTKYCSVQASLDPRIRVTNRFEIVEALTPPEEELPYP